MLFTICIACCVFISSGATGNNITSIENVNENQNVLEVNADYVVTVKKQVKVYYKVKKKVKIKKKIRYKSKGKWKIKYKTKYKYRYVYKYYYKTVYRTYTVRDVPPSECKGSTRNCQSTNSAIVSKMKSITTLINVTVPNPEPAPKAPTPIEKPIEVSEPGPEPQLSDFGGNETAYNELWNAWNETNTTYANYLEVNQTYNQYLHDYNNYLTALSQYKKTITVTRAQTTMEKANSIFEFVQHYLDYSFYYNTKYGAVGTLSMKKGNCVDHTHLLIALARAAGIPARYVHGQCTFNSGFRTGHVWAQLYVNGKWYNADAISFSNKLGTIANWNTATYTLKGIYSSLPF
ncbi:transglutaminase-like domain-containing protein [Methanobacterium oryzae]|uniref:transglutaminase-like domain-containing protein n=1 Tax=Methanobacterium oryzae TaxID=69540 RepID=UPI003D1F6C29